MNYVELHCHSNYSFQEGASFVDELLVRAKELGYPGLALTDHDNLCGAMEFARVANSIGIKPITGAEITLNDGSHLTLLAQTRKGYSNLCNLITASHMGMDGKRTKPRLNPTLLQEHSEDLILLTGCSKGNVPTFVKNSRFGDAKHELEKYLNWFGTKNVFVELQQNHVYGDSLKNSRLVQLARSVQVNIVATNNVHYHIPERHRLQDTLVSIKHNKTLEESHLERRANTNFHLKSYKDMSLHFRNFPDAIENTLSIAESCSFNLESDLRYKFPNYGVIPPKHTTQSYLEHICNQAAIRKYGLITSKVRQRLDSEFGLIKKHSLAGFFLIYYEVIQIAREVMIDLGHGDPEIPLEERPPGRGRGSSVSMLVGYLIGLSHIDPLKYDLNIDRFINDDMGKTPDIDIDFPREIREETIIRIHRKYGWDKAALTGAIATYKIKGCIRDIGKTLGIPANELDTLAKKIDTRHADNLKAEMSTLPYFQQKVANPVWNMLIELAIELQGFPKYLMQHTGGMIISNTPLTNLVPVVPGGIKNRYICQWDKDTIADAGFVKIDFLGLGALSQMQEALELIEKRTGKFIDLSQIDFEDQEVYKSIQRADTIGVFQIESAAQMQTVIRLKPNNLHEMAYEVAAVRPGVGIGNGIRQFIQRYRSKIEWDYDHPTERKALERTMGIILYQDQVNQLAVDVAGFSYVDGDNLRRAFSRKNNKGLIKTYWEKFRDGAAEKSVPVDISKKIFGKFSGQYMFPESHAYAFGVTAYQMSWLKHHHPLEFYVAIFNQQPMGFYNIETLKEDAKRHGIDVLNPDINISSGKCTIVDQTSFILGILNIKGIGETKMHSILHARSKCGKFLNLDDAMKRSRINRSDIEKMILAGAFDSMESDRRSALWRAGLISKTIHTQRTLPLPVDQDIAQLPLMNNWESMLGEYKTMGIHPNGHFMAHIRKKLPSSVVTSEDLVHFEQGSNITVAGLVIRRQHPATDVVFVTLEDEFGHVPLVIWPKIFEKYRLAIKEPVLKVQGFVSRRDQTLNIVAQNIEHIDTHYDLPHSRNWE